MEECKNFATIVVDEDKDPESIVKEYKDPPSFIGEDKDPAFIGGWQTQSFDFRQGLVTYQPS